jgi:Uma2 family endonuclease
MDAQTAIGVENYLGTSFPDLDREYKDGAILERSLPDYLHGKIQLLLGAFFLALRQSHAIYPSVETRMRLRPGLIYIPDVAVFCPEEPAGLPDKPPLVVIEVLSLDDRLSDVRAKLGEYRAWGVQNVWLVDPHAQRFYVCDSRLREVETLTIEGMGIELTKKALFG